MAVKDKGQIAIDISSKIATVNDIFSKSTSKIARKHKLTLPQLDALNVVKSHGAVPLKIISQELMVTGANITCVMDNLEKESLVQRVFSKEDRRVILAELTKKGETKINKLLPLCADTLTDKKQ